jgi:hypothetical protein
MHTRHLAGPRNVPDVNLAEQAGRRVGQRRLEMHIRHPHSEQKLPDVNLAE